MNKVTDSFKRMRSVMLTATVYAVMAISMLSCTGNEEVKNDDEPGGYFPGAANEIDLSTLTAESLTDATFTVTDSMVLTGTLDGQTQKIKIVIADGATVTLADAAINGVHYGVGSRDTECIWAGLTCLGDATIILADGTTNTVTNFNRSYPCIHVTEGKTLVIKGDTEGTGKLIANNSRSGAGIGGGFLINCGNIHIDGGIIQANGSRVSAGIGSGNKASCGNITITGGNITATGGYDSAGIGSGQMANCGNITITGGNITATGGGNGAGIGTGNKANCGDISISGGVILAQGGEKAAGIGCGNGQGMDPSSCGDIIIYYNDSFVKVTAIRGKDAKYSIGQSNDNNEVTSCGVVKFGNRIVKKTDDNDMVVLNDMFFEGLHFTISTTVPEGETNEGPYRDNTWILELKP